MATEFCGEEILCDGLVLTTQAGEEGATDSQGALFSGETFGLH